MNRKKWMRLVMALLILALLVWRFMPRSFSDMMGAEGELGAIEIHLMVMNVEEGEHVYTHYALKSDSSDTALLSILDGKGYCPCLLNLSPIKPLSTSANPYIGVTCAVAAYWDDRSHASYMTMLDRKKCTINDEIYHPVNKGTLEALADYVMANGTIAD